MVDYVDDSERLVPLEIGIQTGETVIMWVGGAIFGFLSLILLGLAVGLLNSLYGLIMFILGGIIVLASQFFTPYDPMRTMRFPLTGLILWIWTVLLLTPVFLTGWNEYIATSTDTLIFLLTYGFLALMATVGLLLSYYLTSLKILKWMNQDVPTTMYVAGVIATIVGMTMLGFNNSRLLDIETLTIGHWIVLFLFAMSYLLFLELNNGAQRFNEIISYAKEQAVGDFSLTPVINNYYILGAILMIIVGVVMIVFLLINLFMRWVTPLINAQLADSVMMNTVYSVVFTITAILVPLGIILTLFFNYRNKKEEEEEKEMRRTGGTGRNPGMA